MSQVETVSVALSLVLGLAVAHVLASGLSAFRARRETQLDAMPFAWAGYIFVSQLQFWWGPVFLLTTFDRVSGFAFTVLVSLAVLLFVAGGLVLPSGGSTYPPDLKTYFDKDGRWGVLAYGLYWLLIIPLNNVAIYGFEFSHPANISGASMAPIAAVAFWSPKVRRGATILAGAVLLVNTLQAAGAILSRG